MFNTLVLKKLKEIHKKHKNLQSYILKTIYET